MEAGSGRGTRCMIGSALLDTNVLVNLFDRDSPRKREVAREILGRRSEDGTAVLSTQVLQEFYAVATRKLARPLPSEDAERAVRDFAALPLIQVDAAMILRAIGRRRRMSLSVWDALVVQAAIDAGCDLLLTEDLQDGQRIEGLVVQNPFSDVGKSV